MTDEEFGAPIQVGDLFLTSGGYYTLVLSINFGRAGGALGLCMIKWLSMHNKKGPGIFEGTMLGNARSFFVEKESTLVWTEAK